MLDSYYTPKDIAQRLVAHMSFTPRAVCDFCAGGGELILACKNRFPKIRCFAFDKSKIVVRRLRQRNPDWEVAELDVLSNRQLAAIKEERKLGFDMIVINPPFSAKGKIGRIRIEEFEFKASPALNFVYRLIGFLSPSGHLLGILPSSSLYSERDAALVDYLKTMYRFKVLDYVQKASFSGKSPNVVLVDISLKHQKRRYRQLAKINEPILQCLFRGACNVVQACRIACAHGGRNINTIGYVHSTNLKNGRVQNVAMYLPVSAIKPIEGPAVLLPRVGAPSKSKVSVIKAHERYGLSDCVIAILCRTYSAALTVQRSILSRELEYVSLYQGTGAKYITMKRLSSFINSAVEDKRLLRDMGQ